MKWLALLFVVVASCKGHATPAAEVPPPPPQQDPAAPPHLNPITTVEVTRSRDACTAYATRLCKCAETIPSLAKQCELDRSMPPALELATSTATSPETSSMNSRLAERTARRIAAACIESAAKLDVAGCH